MCLIRYTCQRTGWSLAPRVEVEQYGGEITMDSDWWIISNSLPYAARAAYDPGYNGRRGGGAGDWFTRIENGLPKDAEKASSTIS